MRRNLIGENMEQPGNFTNRTQTYKDNECPKQFYEWSELKSSYFVKNIIKNDEYNTYLVNRMKTHSEYLCNICKIKLDDAISNYLYTISTDGSKNISNPYPVGQMQMFKGEPNIKLLNNFYALYNFNKFLFLYSIGPDVLQYHSSNNLSLDVNLIVFRYYYNIIQQKIFRVQQTIRGNRVDIQYREEDKSDILGISNNRYSTNGIDEKGSTVLKVKDFPSKSVVKWQHPGINSCRPFFNGKYGQKIKQYIGDTSSVNNFFSSLQCGISASTNYVLFPVLFSIELPKDDVSTQRILEDIIIMAALGLCGDGGHNLREVLSGIVITFELCKIMSEKFIQEVSVINPNPVNGNLYEQVKATLDMNNTDFHNNMLYTNPRFNTYASSIYKNIYDDLKPNNYTDDNIVTIFKEFTKKFYYLGSFCNTGVNITSNINITGITVDDLISSYNMNVNMNVIPVNLVNQEISNLTTWLYNNVIMSPYDKPIEFYNVNNMNNLQILLSLLNERYKKDNFNKGVTEFYNSILSRRDLHQIIQNINDELSVIIVKKCDFKITTDIDVGLMKNVKITYEVEPEHIPYA